MDWKGKWTRFREVFKCFVHVGRLVLPPADFITDCLVIRNFHTACLAWELECHWRFAAAVPLLLPIVGGIALAVIRLYQGKETQAPTVGLIMAYLLWPIVYPALYLYGLFKGKEHKVTKYADEMRLVKTIFESWPQVFLQWYMLLIKGFGGKDLMDSLVAYGSVIISTLETFGSIIDILLRIFNKQPEPAFAIGLYPIADRTCAIV